MPKFEKSTSKTRYKGQRMLVNLSQSEQRGDLFFKATAFELLKVLHGIAEETCYPDLIMVQALLHLPQLAQRISLAQKQESIDLWISASPSQLVVFQTSLINSLQIINMACCYLDFFLRMYPSCQYLSKADWLMKLELRKVLAEFLLPLN